MFSKQLIMKNYGYLLAFFIPLLFLNALFAIKGIAPFGGNSLLQEDLNNQYISYLSYYKDSILSGHLSNFIYSFSMSLGNNMSGLDAYYYLNPLFVLLLFFNTANLPFGIYLVSNLMVGLIGVSMFYFCKHSKLFGINNYLSLIFSLCYALMSYNIAYLSNLMWLPDIALLPLLALGIEKLIRSNKVALYFTTLSLSIFFNFYIGYMLCLFSALYFVYLWLISYNKTFLSFRELLKTVINFALFSLCTVLINMFLLLPNVIATAAAKTSSSQTDFSFTSILNPFLLIRSFLLTHNTLYGVPNIFCGLIVAVFLTAYFISNRITKKEKWLSVGLLCIIFLSFQFQFFNVVWHLFKNPLGFPYRNSFVFSFVLLLLCMRFFNKIGTSSISIKNFKKAYIYLGLIAAFTILSLYFANIMTPWKSLVISMFFYGAYALFFHMIGRARRWKSLLQFILICLVGFDLLITGLTSVKEEHDYASLSDYQHYVADNQSKFNYIQKYDHGFFRTEKNYERTGASFDDSMMFSYFGINHYSSSLDFKTRETASLLGYTSFNTIWPSWINYNNGGLISSDTLLGLKYVLVKTNNSNDAFIVPTSFKKIHTFSDGTILYKNTFFSGIGWLSTRSLSQVEPSSNIFNYQNSIWSSINDHSQRIFTSVHPSVTYVNLHRSHHLLYRENMFKPAYIQLKYHSKNRTTYFYMTNGNDYSFSSNTFILYFSKNRKLIYPTNLNNGVIPIKQTKSEKSEVRLYVQNDGTVQPRLAIYSFNTRHFQSLLPKTYNQFNIKRFSSTNIQGTIRANRNGYLVLTIPYDKNWHVYIDGQLVQAKTVMKNFMEVPVSIGKHKITLKYINRQLIIGLIISVLTAITLFIGFVVYRFKNTLKRHEST